ncbi:MAG: hypothetical protein MJZ98_03235 [Paludibacteraceae bacterium]|nr:hypothetical protein [Paludibacteraceae bacterium]
MKTRNTLSILSTMLFVAALFCGCKPDLQVSDVQYYTILNNKYLLVNDHAKFIAYIQNDWIINEDGDTIANVYGPTDYYIEGNNHYETGFYQIVTKKGEYAQLLVEERRPYIKINGEYIHYETEPAVGAWPRFVPADDGLYIFYSETYPTGELDRLGRTMYGHNYKIAKNGERPITIANQENSELGGRVSAIKNIKKYDGNFYFVGAREQCPYFSDAEHLSTPFILSMEIGESTDFCKIGNKFLICGHYNNLARYWTFDGTNIEEFELPITEDATESYAGVIDLVGDDIYIGGRIGTKPAIWKNGEIFAIYEEFPPHQDPYYLEARPDVRFYYHSGFVRALRVVGDKAYSIVVTTNAPNSFDYIDNKLMAVEWDFSKEPASCRYKYDLVEMLRDGSLYLYESFYHNLDHSTLNIIVPHETYWGALSYTTPRIELQYVK